MQNDINTMGSLGAYKRLMNYVKPYWLVFVFAILGTLIYSGIDAGFTYSLKPLLNKGFIEKDLNFVKWMPVFVLLAFGLRGAANFVSVYATSWIARNVIMVFRQEIFQKMLTLPARYYDQHSSGQLLSKLLYNVEQLSNASTNAFTSILQSGGLILGLVIVMVSISWQLCLVYLLITPVVATVVTFTSRRTRRISHRVQAAMSDVTEIAEESLEGYRVVRTFGGHNYQINKFNKATSFSRNQDMKVASTRAISVSTVQIVAAAALSAIIFITMQTNLIPDLSAGAFVAMVAAMLALLKPMKNITNLNTEIQRGIAGAQSIFELLDEVDEVDDGTQSIDRAEGNIEFNDICFKYGEDSEVVLEKVGFRLKAGETVALVGRSGSGKTTLASLLARFYDVTSGSITLDGIDLREFKLKDLRNQIAIVTQHITLFNDTIANNIAYGRADQVSEAEIISAAKAAHALEFIEELPEGLQTQVGENGVLLSGGQRQRIAIARAILKNAPILILDEATSALDTESERHIQAALEAVMKNRTTLVIAHRLSTIENADKIVVIDHGKLVEQGTHAELLNRHGAYAKLHAMQYSEQSQQLEVQLEPELA